MALTKKPKQEHLKVYVYRPEPIEWTPSQPVRKPKRKRQR